MEPPQESIKLIPSFQEIKKKYVDNNYYPNLTQKYDLLKKALEATPSDAEVDVISYNCFKYGSYSLIFGFTFPIPYHLFSYLNERQYVLASREKILGDKNIAKVYTGKIDFWTIYESLAKTTFKLGILGTVFGLFYGCHQIFNRKSDDILLEKIKQIQDPKSKSEISEQKTHMIKNAKFGFLTGLVIGWFRFSKKYINLVTEVKHSSVTGTMRFSRLIMDGFRGSLLALPLSFVTIYSLDVAKKFGALGLNK